MGTQFCFLIKFLKNSLHNFENNNNETTLHKIYYENQCSDTYKTDERVLKTIIKRNTMCINPAERIQLVIYCKSNTVNNLVMRNNHSPPLPILKQTNLIYEYTCKYGDCELHPSSYIGLTTTTLSKRLTMHLSRRSTQETYARSARCQIDRRIK